MTAKSHTQSKSECPVLGAAISLSNGLDGANQPLPIAALTDPQIVGLVDRLGQSVE
jgi:hypothetical protein